MENKAQYFQVLIVKVYEVIVLEVTDPACTTGCRDNQSTNPNPLGSSWFTRNVCAFAILSCLEEKHLQATAHFCVKTGYVQNTERVFHTSAACGLWHPKLNGSAPKGAMGTRALGALTVRVNFVNNI